MRFPKAYAGVKKIFTSEILSLISTILLVIVAAVAAVDESGELPSGKNGAIAVVAIVGLIALVLGLIATILQLVGLHSASKNEGAFKTAFFFALIMLIITAVGGAVATKNENSIISDLPSLLNIFVFIFTVSGISNLARKLGREDMASCHSSDSDRLYHLSDLPGKSQEDASGVRTGSKQRFYKRLPHLCDSLFHWLNLSDYDGFFSLSLSVILLCPPCWVSMTELRPAAFPSYFLCMWCRVSMTELRPAAFPSYFLCLPC